MSAKALRSRKFGVENARTSCSSFGSEGRANKRRSGIRRSVPVLEYRSCVGSTADEACRCLQDFGFTVLEGLVPHAVCDEVITLIEAARARASEDDYTRIHNPKLRKDLPLPLHRFASSPLATMFNARDRLLPKVLEDTVKKTAGMVEFASMTILPGAQAQPVHQDVHMASAVEDENARYITVFLSLCNVDDKQGPMELWAGTHRMYIPWPESKDDVESCGDDACTSDEDEELSRRSAVDENSVYVQGETVGEEKANQLAELTKRHMQLAKGTIKLYVRKGDVYLVDPRVLHRGTSNLAGTPKRMLYLSFEEREGKLTLLGSTDSMLERLKGRYTLSDVLGAVCDDDER